VTEIIEYRVWTETSDLVYNNRNDADVAMAEAIADHVAYAECHGCGVLTEARDHGYHLQICADDRDVTGDPTYI
jgi:hypothetical protein